MLHIYLFLVALDLVQLPILCSTKSVIDAEATRELDSLNTHPIHTDTCATQVVQGGMLALVVLALLGVTMKLSEKLLIGLKFAPEIVLTVKLDQNLTVKKNCTARLKTSKQWRHPSGSSGTFLMYIYILCFILLPCARNNSGNVTSNRFL